MTFPIWLDWSANKKIVDILDTHMAYVESGRGDPIVFLHGNPTSSYLWRNILPACESLGRCLAPDLIGMGDSAKLPNSISEGYTLAEHRRYLDAWFERLGLTENVTLVLHDWGTALGFDWASRHPAAVKGIVYMEPIIGEISWADWPPPVAEFFRAVRSPVGEELVLQKNLFIEQAIPSAVLRTLDGQDMVEYRRPFTESGKGRLPMLSFARQLPIEGEPATSVRFISDYRNWLLHSPVPKLFINAEPGSTALPLREICRTFPNQQEVTVKGIHFLQEDSPVEISQAIANWFSQINEISS
ncbi:Haloalkane dehalogenase [Serratia quinivorans]|uniref:haloalkane dehalogenase n=1 Tax=Serratia quinivorans TaxID=137545 RepID=UPI000D83BB7C|nr:haloalkane dehalogenase [Serratia quinivorans]SPZ60709.1 Haloalkane dehalogenase [Serratia quinivorans]VEI65709.1 Haloalkane dehalogenase [Serratia quinivorans]